MHATSHPTTTHLALLSLICATLAISCGRSPFDPRLAGTPCNDTSDCGIGLECINAACTPSTSTTPNTTPATTTPNTTPTTTPPPDPCQPNTALCADDRTLLLCGPDGNLFEEPCNLGRCFNGACIAECTNGQQLCTDDRTQRTCAGGRWEDVTCAPGESCIENACQPEQPNNRLPDIEPRFSLNQRTVQPGAAAFFELTAINNTSTPTGDGFICDIFAMPPNNRPQINRDILVRRVEFTFGIPGNSASFESDTLFLDDLERGRSYDIYAACDLGNRIEETNENNNISTPQRLRILPEPPSSTDLNVSLDEADPTSATYNDTISVFYTLSNEGETSIRDAVDCTVLLTHRDTGESFAPLEFREFAPIEPGQSIQNRVTFTLDPNTPPALYTLGLTCFPNGLEDNNLNNNNSVFGQFEILEDGTYLDLSLRSFELGSPFVTPYTSAPFTATLCNEGDRTADQVTLRLGANAGIHITLGQNLEIGRLLPNQCVTIEDRIDRVLCSDSTQDFTLPLEVVASSNLPDYLELNPDDNLINPFPSIELRCSAPAQNLPNLDVFLVSLSQPAVYLDEPFTYTASFYNHALQTPSPASIDEPFDVQITLTSLPPSSSVLEEILTETIPAGALNDPNDPFVFQREITLRSGLNPGLYALTITLDPNNQIEETDAANNTRSIFFEVLDPGLDSCGDDLEPETTEFPGLPIGSGDVLTELEVCGDRADHFTFCPEAGAILEATVEFEHDNGDIDLELYDTNNTLLSRANSGTNTETLSTSDTDNHTCYVLKVTFAEGGARTNTYTLRVVESEAPNPGSCDERGEPNNAFTSATPLNPSDTSQNFDLCPRGDVDIFSITNATEPLNLQISTSDPNAQGSFSLIVFDGNQNFVEQRFAPSIDMTLEPNATQRLFLRIITDSNADRFPYSIRLSPTAP